MSFKMSATLAGGSPAGDPSWGNRNPTFRKHQGRFCMTLKVAADTCRNQAISLIEKSEQSMRRSRAVWNAAQSVRTEWVGSVQDEDPSCV